MKKLSVLIGSLFILGSVSTVSAAELNEAQLERAVARAQAQQGTRDAHVQYLQALEGLQHHAARNVVDGNGFIVGVFEAVDSYLQVADSKYQLERMEVYTLLDSRLAVHTRPGRTVADYMIYALQKRIKQLQKSTKQLQKRDVQPILYEYLVRQYAQQIRSLQNDRNQYQEYALVVPALRYARRELASLPLEPELAQAKVSASDLSSEQSAQVRNVLELLSVVAVALDNSEGKLISRFDQELAHVPLQAKGGVSIPSLGEFFVQYAQQTTWQQAELFATIGQKLAPGDKVVPATK